METNEVLACKICLYPYQSETRIPKIIQCGHTICHVCYDKIISSQNKICPFCKKELSKAFIPLINYEVLSLIQFKKLSNSCPIHEKESLLFFCQDCRNLICQLCVLNKHLGHKLVKPEESEISSFIKSYESFQVFASESNCNEMNQQNYLKDIMNEIQEYFEGISALLDELKCKIFLSIDYKYNQIKQLRQDINQIDHKFTSEYDLIKKGNYISKEKVDQLNEDFNQLKDKMASMEKISNNIQTESNMKKVFPIAIQMMKIGEELNLFLKEKKVEVDLRDIENSYEFLISKKRSVIRYKTNSSSQEHISLISSVVMSHEEMEDCFASNIMKSIDRIDFVLISNPHHSYNDSPLSIGWNTTISAPHMHLITLYYFAKYVDSFPLNAKAIDIGCGSGYLTVALSKLLGPYSVVYGLDHIDGLIGFSKANIEKRHRDYVTSGRIKFVCRDGRSGYQEEGPYHIIHVGAAVEAIPQDLIDQLAIGGIIWASVGPKSKVKNVILGIKEENGKLKRNQLMPVNYAEMQSVEEQLNQVDLDESI